MDSNMLKITINGVASEVPNGTTILEAAKLLDIHIPTLCHHPKLSVFGGCRLCIVEVKGGKRPVISCATPVADGMEVKTSTPRIEEIRKTIIELILSDHPNDCMICEKAGDCTLQELAYFYGIRENRFAGERRTYDKKDNNPFIERDMEKCILCGKCVSICDEIQGVGAIDFSYRGFNAKVCPPFEKDLNCEFCGQCVSVCPTGALTGKMWSYKGRQKDVREVDTICPYCGCGCSLTLHVRQNKVIRVSSKENTINEGWLCPKGRFGYSFIDSPERLKTPLIKENGKFREATWDEALDLIASKLKKIRSKHGPDSIGGLSSARCTNEENYIFQKFIRAAIGTNNVDHCARY
ncbi:MAG: NADH dehydrogenase [Nitrospirae bacterium GWC2_42_7]|nr:MAG: NADH dehydrogenase [Nitrospirae bacterium GWC2_42_7]